jgi:hypothetical protein
MAPTLSLLLIGLLPCAKLRWFRSAYATIPQPAEALQRRGG